MSANTGKKTSKTNGKTLMNRREVKAMLDRDKKKKNKIFKDTKLKDLRDMVYEQMDDSWKSVIVSQAMDKLTNYEEHGSWGKALVCSFNRNLYDFIKMIIWTRRN